MLLKYYSTKNTWSNHYQCTWFGVYFFNVFQVDLSSFIGTHITDVSVWIGLVNGETLLQVKNVTGFRWDINPYPYRWFSHCCDGSNPLHHLDPFHCNDYSLPNSPTETWLDTNLSALYLSPKLLIQSLIMFVNWRYSTNTSTRDISPVWEFEGVKALSSSTIFFYNAVKNRLVANRS